MSVRWSNKRVVQAIKSMASTEDSRSLASGFSAVRKAESAAYGKRSAVDLSDSALRKVEARDSGSAGGNVPPAIRVMASLGRMRQLATRGTSREIRGAERASMNDELNRLSLEIDEISTQITRSVPRGEIPADYDSVEAFFESVFADETLDGLLDPFSSYSLGVDAKSISLSSVASSRIAREAIDDALGEMQVIHQNGASTEAHLDAALDRLAAFVETIEPGAVLPQGPDEALEAAEVVKLYLMSGRGVSSIDHYKNLQQSVTALLQ